MTLPFYLIRRFLRSLATVAGAFALLLWFIELIESVRRQGSEGSIGQAAGLATLGFPSQFHMILPLIILLAAIAMLTGLARGSELVAIRAAGRSALRMLVAPVVAVLLVGGLSIAVLNPIVSATGKRHAEAAGNGLASIFSLGDGVVWLRQSVPESTDGPAGQAVIRAGGTSADATTLFNSSFLLFDADGAPVRRHDAASARLGNGEWHLREVKTWPLTAPNPEAAANHEDRLQLPTNLTIEGIRDGFGDPAMIPIWQLPGFIAGLESAGFSALRHRMHLQMELAAPLLMTAMLLIAACFTMHQLRGSRTGLSVLSAFGAGLALFFLAYFAQVLGERGDISAPLAAWTPPVAAILIAVSWLLRSEDG